MHERPLVAFTLLAQSAAGLYCILASSQLALAAFGWTGVVYLDGAALRVTFALALLAMLVSLLHLGTPRKAVRAVVNLRSSWLSREVFALSLFCACLAAQAAYSLRWNPGDISPLVLVATCLLAVTLVFCISRVYRLRTVPAWDSPRTSLSFVCGSVVLGAIAALVLLSAQGALQPAPGRPALPVNTVIPLLLGACLALEVVLVLPRTGLETRRARYGAIRAHPLAPPRARFLVGTLLAFAFALVALAVWFRADNPPGQTAWLVLALFVIAAAQIIDRYIFYAAGSSQALWPASQDRPLAQTAPPQGGQKHRRQA